MTNKKINKSDLARQILLENPTIETNRTLAKLLYTKYNGIFKDIEDARYYIRTVQGSSGKAQLRRTEKIVGSFKERLEAARKAYPAEASDHFNVEPYVFAKASKKALIISDIHIGHQNNDAIDMALEEGDKFGIDSIIINGDLMDFPRQGKWLVKPSSLSVQEELDEAEKFLNMLRMVFPKQSIVYHAGNHCYSADTQVLVKGKGFINFSELSDDDLVAQFDANGVISYAKPVSRIARKHEGDMYLIENSYTKQCVTDLHDVVVGDKKVKAKDLKIEDIKNIPLRGYIERPDYNISDDFIRLLTNVVCDATLVDERKYNSNSTKRRVQFKLSKERKIQHLEELLTRMEVPYTKTLCKKTGINVLQPYYIRIYGEAARNIFDLLNDKKEFPAYFKDFSNRQAKIVADELSITDGYIKDNAISLISVCKKDIETLFEMFATNGILCSYKSGKNKSGFENGKQQYHLKVRVASNEHPVNNKIEIVPYNDMVYCVEMPLGTVVTRLDGKIAYSGNCARWDNYVIRNAAELFGLGFMQLPEVLKLREKKVEYVPHTHWMEYGNLMVAHGHHIVKGIFAPVSPARGVQMKTFQSTIIGHLHKSSEHLWTNMQGKQYGTWSTGCLCDLKPEYNPQVGQCNLGFALVEKDASGDFEVYNKKIIKGKVR